MGGVELKNVKNEEILAERRGLERGHVIGCLDPPRGPVQRGTARNAWWRTSDPKMWSEAKYHSIMPREHALDITTTVVGPGIHDVAA